MSTSVEVPWPATTTGEASRYGVSASWYSWLASVVEVKTSEEFAECSACSSATGGEVDAGIVTSARTWKTMGSVISRVRKVSPAEKVTSPTGGALNVTVSSTVAAVAHAGS